MTKPTVVTTDWKSGSRSTVVSAPVRKKEASWGYFLAAVAVVVAIGALLIFNMEASQIIP